MGKGTYHTPFGGKRPLGCSESSSDMKIKKKTALCVFFNILGLVALLVFVFGEAPSQSILQFGPSPDLTVLQVRIDTWRKYTYLILANCLSRSLDVLVNDIGSPNLGFSIYDPTKTRVFGFEKWELQVLAQLMWLTNQLINIFRLMVTVSRFDIALLATLSSEVTSVITIRYLLNNKSAFYPEFETEEEWKMSYQGEMV